MAMPCRAPFATSAPLNSSPLSRGQLTQSTRHRPTTTVVVGRCRVDCVSWPRLSGDEFKGADVANGARHGIAINRPNESPLVEVDDRGSRADRVVSSYDRCAWGYGR